MEFNKYQSTLEELKVDKYPKEVQENFFRYLNGVPFIQRLISPDRKYIKDLPKDKDGHAIIDITNPPIVTDTDYFRPMAIYYNEHGKYTDLKPNPNPHSKFGKLIEREADRIYNGYTRPDGAWISGDLYFYLNYSQIAITKKINETSAIRVPGFPSFWEGSLWRSIGWKESRDKGLNFAEIAKRGAGKSFTVASKLAKNFLFGDTKVASKKVLSGVMGNTKEYLNSDGTLNKFEAMIDFLAQNTEFPSKRLTSSLDKMNYKMGYVDLNTGTKKGTLNEVIGIAVKEEPDKPRGKRFATLVCEEFGTFPKLSETYTIVQPSVRNGDFAFGQIILIGTGGSKGSNFSGALGMIYHPDGYHLLSYDNVWDISQDGRGKSIWFFPGYVNREGCYNKDGISDVTKALLRICLENYNAKYNTDDPKISARVKAENPVTIQDSILKSDSTIFPVADLKERIFNLDSNPSEFDKVYTGKMIQDSKTGKAGWIPTKDEPIRFFPHKDNKLSGAVEIFAMPKKDRNGKVYSKRYIGGIDPYDDDASNTKSLGSIFILDMWTDEIVAEYTGRPMFADDFYEQCRLLSMFYNAPLNYENNKKGLYGYFKKMNCTYLLTDELEFLKNKDTSSENHYGNKIKGTNASLSVNNEGRSRLRDWLLLQKKIVKKVDGEEKEITVRNLYTVRNRALLEECAQWNAEGNFDRVSAMGMLMLLREDRMVSYGKREEQDEEATDPMYEGNDSFFMNYDARFAPDKYKIYMEKNKKIIDMIKRKSST